MPSPVIGMNPYLESTNEWRDMHMCLFSYSAEIHHLNQLPHEKGLCL